MINWSMVQALATVALVMLAVVDSVVYYGWHAKHERQQQNPYSPEAIRELQSMTTTSHLQEYKELPVKWTGR